MSRFFFVITGYSITLIILKEFSKSNNFSIINFYLRRSRRIIPNLFVVILDDIDKIKNL